MSENEIMQEDEISLFDLWEKLQAGWRYVLGGTSLGLLGAVLALVLIQPKYEAVAVVQVGQVGQVGQAPLPIEAPAQSVERLKTASFQMTVAERIGHNTWVNDLRNSTTATTKYLKAQLIKASPNLIEITTSGDSPDAAKKVNEAIVFDLLSRQAEIAKPLIEKMRLDLLITKEKLASAEKELEGLNKMFVNVGVKDDRFTQISLITSLRVQKEAEVFVQRQTIMAYETALMPPATQSAKAIESVFVVDKPVSPKKTLLLALGLFGGLLVGVMWVFVGDAWRRARAVRKPS